MTAPYALMGATVQPDTGDSAVSSFMGLPFGSGGWREKFLMVKGV